MISNYKIKTLQKSRQTQLNTCLFESIKPKSSPLNSTITSLNSKKTLSGATMSSMTADFCAVAAAAAATAAKTTTRKPPMEAVVVNSIIYSKPSFCSIVVDLGGSAGGEVSSLKDKLPKLLNGACPDKTSNNTGFNSTTMPFPLGFASACLTGFSSPPPSVAAQQDAQLYRMCTTMNGSIHHQISDLCDNLLAMAGFFDAATNEHDNDDDDDLVEFVYDDGHYMEEEEFNTEDENEDDEDEETDDDEDDIDVEYCNNNYDDCLDDDHDTVDFTYGFPTINTPKLICDKGKKVRFNTKPTIHVMHTWNYAYRAARKGQWEMYARDRERFRLRIQRTSLILNPILNREHRQKIFEKRFVNIFDTDSDRQTPDDVKIKTTVATEKVENKSSHTESKNSYQKKKPKKRRRFCKMGNKHYF